MNQLFIRQAAIDWERIASDDYLRRIPALQGLERLELSAPVTFFVGDNGTGKSTLLEAVASAWGLNPEGGSRNFRFSTRDTHSSLYRGMRLRKGWRQPEDHFFLRAESFYNVATKEMEYVDPRHPSRRYHERSHGESFLELFQWRLGGGGLFLFDEPEAALSPQRQMTLLAEIYRSAQAGSQFVLATHSPILLAIPGAVLLSFDDGAIHPCAYEETGSYQITKLFLGDRERVLRELLAEPAD